MDFSDEKWMKLALKEALKASAKGEVPVGAVMLFENKVIARAHNVKESRNDPLGHAEILLIKKVAKKLGRWRLSDCTLYVSLEPCCMCYGAIVQARVGQVKFAAFDQKAGVCGSQLDLPAEKKAFNFHPKIEGGICERESQAILSSFFSDLRKRRTKDKDK